MAEVISLKTRRPLVAEHPREHSTHAEETDLSFFIGLRNAIPFAIAGWVAVYWIGVGLVRLAETALTALGWG